MSAVGQRRSEGKGVEYKGGNEGDTPRDKQTTDIVLTVCKVFPFGIFGGPEKDRSV